MLRKLVEQDVGPLSDTEFKAALAMATIDIKCKRIEWMQRTNLKEVIKIASQSVTALRRCS